MARLKALGSRVATLPSPLTRKCKGCQQELSATLEVFPPQAGCKYGLYTHCRPCKKIQDAEKRARPDQMARQQAWRDGNRERVKAYNQTYREQGYVSTSDVRRWRMANLEKSRAYDRAKIKRYRQSTWHKLKGRVSFRMWAMLKGCGGKARQKTEDLLGYSLEDLQAHLERQFTKGMSWEALHRGEIHIDHITPVSSFRPISHDCPEFKRCWALSNLRPMWAKENMSKGAKKVTLL